MATFEPSISEASIIVGKLFYPVTIFTIPETTICSSDLLHQFPPIYSTPTNNSSPSTQKMNLIPGQTSIEVDTIPGCMCGKLFESLPGILWTT